MNREQARKGGVGPKASQGYAAPGSNLAHLRQPSIRLRVNARVRANNRLPDSDTSTAPSHPLEIRSEFSALPPQAPHNGALRPESNCQRLPYRRTDRQRTHCELSIRCALAATVGESSPPLIKTPTLFVLNLSATA